MAAGTDPLDSGITGTHGIGHVEEKNPAMNPYRVSGGTADWIHTDRVYNALLNAASVMENRLKESLENYEQHPDVQANLQQLQYDLQSWNLALTTMTNIQKNLADALNSIANNFK